MPYEHLPDTLVNLTSASMLFQKLPSPSEAE